MGARNLYRDEQLDIAGAGEKVRELIEEHVYSTGVNPKILPIDLLDPNYKEQLNQHKSARSQASEIENAINHHIKVNIDEDPVYYKKLSERLEQIIQDYEDKWDELVQLLLDLRENIEEDHKQQATNLGLSPTELSFYNILIAELGGDKAVDAEKAEQVKRVVQSLVEMLGEATRIVVSLISGMSRSE